MNAKYNPFNPNSIVTPNLFAGRTDYVFNIINKLEQAKRGMPSSFFMHGVRGIGKTALARLVKHIATAKDPALGNLNFLTSYYSVDKGQNISSVLQESVNDLSDQIPKNVAKILGSKLGKLFQNGKFTIGAFGLEMKSSQQEAFITLKDQMISILSNLIEAIKTSNQSDETPPKDGILIVIDELHHVSDISYCAQLLRNIITTLTVKEKGYISFLLIGYDHTKDDFFEADESSRRAFDCFQLGVMSPHEAGEILTKGFDEVDVAYDADSLKKNILVTGGYPHSVQIIGKNLIEVDTDMNISNEDWKEAINLTAKELTTKDFAEFYKFSGKPTGKEEILNILAVCPKPLSPQEIATYCNLKNIYPYLKKLRTSHSIRETENGNLELHSHLLKTAILLKILPIINTEPYLSKLMEIFYTDNEN